MDRTDDGKERIKTWESSQRTLVPKSRLPIRVSGLLFLFFVGSSCCFWVSLVGLFPPAEFFTQSGACGPFVHLGCLHESQA